MNENNHSSSDYNYDYNSNNEVDYVNVSTRRYLLPRYNGKTQLQTNIF